MRTRLRFAAAAAALSLFLAICGGITACGGDQAPASKNTAFTEMTETIFKNRSSSDSLTLNYTLSHPENFGITELPDGFPSFSYESIEQEGAALENTLAALEQFDRDSLPLEDRILYDTLKDSLETDIRSHHYRAFSEALGPTTGIQAQLPVLLAEFRIGDRTDLEQYFSLLKSVPGYFSSLLSLEEKKRSLRTLPCRSTIQNIIAQCETYIGDSGASILTKTFERRLADCGFLTEKERKKALRRNSSHVRKYIIPAYRDLIAGLKKLLPDAPENGSLSAYPDGKAYYSALVRQLTGSSRSVEELREMMSGQLISSHDTLLAYAAKDPSLFNTCQSYVAGFSSPDDILAALKKRMAKDFPSLKKNSCEVKYVDESLEDFLSPAFYLTPPLDDNTDNVIYINGSDKYDRSSLFNTLAHEGFPGHLYQTCYMYDKKLPALRYLLNYGGYTEGWATYAEIYSYKYTGVSRDEAGILRNNMIASLCLYGLCDIGVHYEGWDEKALGEFLGQYGTWRADTAAAVYSSVIDEPGTYLKYTVGYLEFVRLKETAKEKTGASYSEKAFHRYVLDMGPTSFSILERYISDWIEQNGCK